MGFSGNVGGANPSITWPTLPDNFGAGLWDPATFPAASAGTNIPLVLMTAA